MVISRNRHNISVNQIVQVRPRFAGRHDQVALIDAAAEQQFERIDDAFRCFAECLKPLQVLIMFIDQRLESRWSTFERSTVRWQHERVIVK